MLKKASFYKVTTDNDGVIAPQTRVRRRMRYREEMNIERVIEKLARPLYSRINHLIVTIEESKDLHSMTIEDLTGSLLFHDKRLLKLKKEWIEQTLEAKAFS